jgi:PKD repeat protein
VCYITVNQGVAPSVDFNANTTNINVGSSINFTDISGNNPTSWLWKFQGGNPTTSTLKNPANINYNTIGCFDVTLIASNAFGTDSLTKTCYINVTAASGAPLANFTSTSTNIFVGDSIDFIDLSSNNPTSWQWIFTNGVPSTSTLKNPTGIKYNTPGCFEVTLIATNSSGSDNETKTCYINVGTNSINSEADNNFECHIFPNPSKGKITITFTNHTKQNKHIVITDLLGRIILEKNTSLFTVNFDLSNEFSGIYFLKYETNNQFIVKTIILEH